MVRTIKGLESAVILIERILLKNLKTHFLSFLEIDLMLNELADQIKDYSPDCVVGVLNSGHYPGKKISNLLGCDYQGLNVSRDPVIVAGVPLNDRILFNRFIRRDHVPTLKGEFEDKSYEKILIVDEDGGSGRTMNIVKNEISIKSKAQIKEAAIFLNNGGYVTDYSLGTFSRLNKFVATKTRFPWFPCSPYYSEYVKRFFE